MTPDSFSSPTKAALSLTTLALTNDNFKELFVDNSNPNCSRIINHHDHSSDDDMNIQDNCKMSNDNDNMIYKLKFLIYMFLLLSFVGIVGMFLVNVMLGLVYDAFIAETKYLSELERIREMKGLILAYSTLDPYNTGFSNIYVIFIIQYRLLI